MDQPAGRIGSAAPERVFRPAVALTRAFALAVLLLAGAAIAILVGTAVTPQPAAVPTNTSIEERWGVRLTRIGVTADGGLVDVRFLVLDDDKALAMMQDVANIPILRSERTGELVRSAALMTSKHSIAPGRTTFLLYRNTRGAIRPGGPLTLVFGDLRLEHATAR